MINKLPVDIFNHIPLEYLTLFGLSSEIKTDGSFLVITGANASGKSFLRRIFQIVFKRNYKFDVIHISQEGRSTSGIARAFVYGSEDDESTGTISAKTFVSGLRTIQGRSEENIDHVMIWDEPEIGMGEELQLGTANWICENLEAWPKHLNGVVIFTHSRFFVERIMKFEGAKFISLDGFTNHNDWLNRKIVPVSPEIVKEKGAKRWGLFQKAISSLKSAKKSS